MRLFRRRMEQIPKDIQEHYLHGKDRLWFPMTSDTLSTMGILDLQRQIPGFPKPLVFATTKKNADRVSSAKLTEKAGVLQELGREKMLHEAYLLPTGSLPSDWIINNSQFQKAMLLMIRTTLEIPHISQEVADPSMMYTDSPLRAIELMQGCCFHRASVLAAALRKNSIPARIVGHFEFFSIAREEQHHWWVEAYVNNQWMTLDPNFSIQFQELIDSMLRNPRIAKDAFFAVLGALSEAYERDMPVHPTLNPQFASKLVSRIEAAEIDLL